jgi:hypothetical protein
MIIISYRRVLVGSAGLAMRVSESLVASPGVVVPRWSLLIASVEALESLSITTTPYHFGVATLGVDAITTALISTQPPAPAPIEGTASLSVKSVELASVRTLIVSAITLSVKTADRVRADIKIKV